MADVFKQLEKGYEAKYKLDEELHFKAHARRNKLLGLWAAGRLELPSAAAAQYAAVIVKIDYDRAGDENLIDKICADFEAANKPMASAAIYQEMDRLYVVAMDQVKNEYPSALDRDYSPVGD